MKIIKCYIKNAELHFIQNMTKKIKRIKGIRQGSAGKVSLEQDNLTPKYNQEDLICTNIMQRGVGNVNPMKMARCIIELERIKGIQNGGDRGNQYKVADKNNFNLPSQKKLATELQISQQQLQNYKKLTKLIPELQQMIENNEVKATIGYKVYAKLSKEEQEKFLNEIGKDKIKELTQKAKIENQRRIILL